MKPPERWELVSGEDKISLEREFLKEVHPRHPLFGSIPLAVARLKGFDDIYFTLKGAPCEAAVVHLTWSRETDPAFPWYTAFANEDDFRENWQRIWDQEDSPPKSGRSVG